MKILFVRHGQSEDDILDAYGGWVDWPITPKGQDQLAETAEEISNLGVPFEKILTSPLKRAISSAEIISAKLKIPVEVFEYVKERNTYGILSGMVKDEAALRYPDQVERYENGEYVDGSERVEDVESRAKRALELLKDMKLENVVVLTHGNFLKALMPVLLDRKLVKKEDGGFILVEISDDGAKVLASDGIEVE
jgi:broad specificity phosphatase PhoE